MSLPTLMIRYLNFYILKLKFEFVLTGWHLINVVVLKDVQFCLFHMTQHCKPIKKQNCEETIFLKVTRTIYFPKVFLNNVRSIKGSEIQTEKYFFFVPLILTFYHSTLGKSYQIVYNRPRVGLRLHRI